MRKGVPSSPHSNFTVELHSSRRPFQKSDVDALVADCPSIPDHSITFCSGYLAARLFFRLLPAALDAVVFFWSRRLDGSHRLTPDLRPTASDELAGRLKTLFSARVRDLLEGESVRRCEKRIAELEENIKRVRAMLRKMNRMMGLSDRQKKVGSLEAEKGLIEKRLEEFRAAMACILVHLDGPRRESCEEIFEFGAGLGWGRIQHLMARECRRLDDGLPIYGQRREILQQIRCNNV